MLCNASAFESFFTRRRRTCPNLEQPSRPPGQEELGLSKSNTYSHTLARRSRGGAPALVLLRALAVEQRAELRLGLDAEDTITTLRREDILAVVKELVDELTATLSAMPGLVSHQQEGAPLRREARL